MNSKYIFILCLIVFCLVSLASVSASENLNKTIINDVGVISTDASEGTLGVSLDDVSNDTLTVSMDGEILSANNWYVNASNTAANRDGSRENPFNNLNETLANPSLNDGDTIYIAGGLYTGESNRNLMTEKALSLISFGSDEVIFDAENKGRFISFGSNEINIIGITFRNGNNSIQTSMGGGALFFTNGLRDSIINATFINNRAPIGGAIAFYFGTVVENCIFDGMFINNIVNRTISNYMAGGGAIGFGSSSHPTTGVDVINCTFYADFVNNTAVNYNGNNILGGGAIFFGGDVANSTFGSIFINNTYLSNVNSGYLGGGAIYFAGQDTVNITLNGQFINNSVNAESGWGGAINVYSTITDSILDAEFIGNYINGDNGAGGAFSTRSAIKYNTIISNGGNNFGGGAFYLEGTTEHTNFTADFMYNNASYGGALYSKGALAGSLFNASFINNTAYDGGALYFMTFNDANIKGRFINNSATNNGGALCIRDHFYYTMDFDNIDADFIYNSAFNNGGAIYSPRPFLDSNISGNFIYNYASEGGAIYIKGSEGNSYVANFTGNNASNGSAIYIYSTSRGNDINSNFINNYADNCGIIYINAISQDDSIFNCLFINNTAKSIICIESGNTEIYDNILLNNIKYFDINSTGVLNITNNWFGHNATDYKEGPSLNGVSCDVWLFLNATANPQTITSTETSEIIFNLFVYDNITGASDVKYDETRLEPVNLTITSTNGAVEKKSAKFGDVLTFTPNNVGNASVTASVEDACDTILLEVNKASPNLSADVLTPVINYTETTTLSLNYNENATGKVNITLTGKKNNYTFNNIDLSKIISISDLIKPDEYNITVVYSGDELFENATVNADKTLLVNKANPNMQVIPHDINVTDCFGVMFTVILPENATGMINVTWCSKTEQFDVEIIGRKENGTLILDFLNDVFPAGEYNATFAYLGDDCYNNSTLNSTSNILKLNFTPVITTNETSLIVNVPDDATGDISVTIDNKTSISPIINGIAEFDISDIPSGDYNATVTYDGDDNYNGFEKIVPISIGGETQVEYDNLTKYYHGSERFTVKVRDSKGNPIANQSLQITINGVTYNRNTDENGTASLAINLNSGEYVTTIVVNNMTFDAIVTVIPTINATDLEKVVLSDRQFYSTFRDSEGNYLKDGTKVKFNVNGITYEHQVYGGEGLAELDINLIQGEYIITSINPITGEMASNNIVVFPRIIENYDITKYFRNGTVFSVKIVDDDCKVAGAGIEVTYNINGVFYTRLTDENGIARLNITLPPGDYIITSECKGCKVSNNVKVLPVLIGEDVVMKYGDGTKFEMKLLDGQGNPFPNQKLKFNVYGVLNEAITDSNGIACVPITLQPGLYLMTTNYSTNGATTSNTILITS